MRRAIAALVLSPLLIAVGVSTGMVTAYRWEARFGSRLDPRPPAFSPRTRVEVAPSTHVRDRESPELRALREADAALFPDLVASLPPPPLAAPNGKVLDEPAPSEPRAPSVFRGGDLWSGLRMPALPVTPHPRTERYLRYFGESPEGRKLFARVLRRSGRFRDVILTALRERALPAELLAVAFVESAFLPEAESPAGAMGLWQFMPHTGRAYGLTIDKYVDERRNPWLATSAAVRHLSDLHQRFGTWEEAIAAYNLGYKGLVDRMEQTSTSNFWALCDVPDVLPTETALYVPKVMAVATLLANLDRFGFDDTALLPPIAAVEVESPPGLRLSLLARAAGTSVRALRELNPDLLGGVLPGRGSVVLSSTNVTAAGSRRVRIPNRGFGRFGVMIGPLAEDAERDLLDTKVATDFDWGKDELLPGLGGKYLGLPRSAAKPRDRAHEAPPSPPPPPELPPPPSEPRRLVRYEVLAGDTVASVARAFGLLPSEVRAQNRLPKRDRLSPGRTLSLRLQPVRRRPRPPPVEPSSTSPPPSGSTPRVL